MSTTVLNLALGEQASLSPAPLSAEERVASAIAALRAVHNRQSLEIAKPSPIELGSMLEMRSVRMLKEKLAEKLAGRAGCRLDGSGVERVSTGGIQVLVSFFAAMKVAGVPVVLWRPSEALMTSINDLGLSDIASGWKVEN